MHWMFSSDEDMAFNLASEEVQGVQDAQSSHRVTLACSIGLSDLVREVHV